MGYSTDPTAAIINVLEKNSSSLGVDEIAFRTRITRSIVQDVLVRLTRTKIVKEDEGKYQLNRQNEFDSSRMFE
ncbi:MAG: hypothetical protein JWQ40_1649 [Segetibacter sp.]|jgi:DNA-binding IclR family transcriptional regulator|nr:hypothetical protein [Segetibacter sp.]